MAKSSASAGGNWVTINGVHVLIGANGKIEKGPAKFIGSTVADMKGGSSKSVAERKAELQKKKETKAETPKKETTKKTETKKETPKKTTTKASSTAKKETAPKKETASKKAEDTSKKSNAKKETAKKEQPIKNTARAERIRNFDDQDVVDMANHFKGMKNLTEDQKEYKRLVMEEVEKRGITKQTAHYDSFGRAGSKTVTEYVLPDKGTSSSSTTASTKSMTSKAVDTKSTTPTKTATKQADKAVSKYRDESTTPFGKSGASKDSNVGQVVSSVRSGVNKGLVMTKNFGLKVSESEVTKMQDYFDTQAMSAANRGAKVLSTNYAPFSGTYEVKFSDGTTASYKLNVN